tara:strand:+ start:2443 stop:3048 length:606 start_codon:yes stop_codon:yes gene_type:complete
LEKYNIKLILVLMTHYIIRIFDIFISIIILIIFSPIIFLITFTILLLDGRPVIYKQLRIGYKGKQFIIFKFRTMNNIILKNEKMRLTILGKILRRTSLDELPQFLNVLNNEMSIVGPRPLPKNIENKIKLSMRKKRRKVLPGITGMSQINYTGKNRKLIEKTHLDMELINNHTIYNYFRILLKTPFILAIRFFKNKSSIIK